MNSSCNLINFGKKFDDPFLLPSSQYIPTGFTETMDFCQFLYYLNPLYYRASERIISHFITDFIFPGNGSSDEKDKFYDYLVYDLDLKNKLKEMGNEERCYGNAFYRIYYPFQRWLFDDKNSVKYLLSSFREEDIKFDLKTMTYEVPDRSLLKKLKDTQESNLPKVKLRFRDFKLLDRTKIKILKINPREIILRKSFFSDKIDYIWRIPSSIRENIKQGVIHQVNDTPISIINAVVSDKDYMFNDNAIFHFKDTCISGVTEGGWAFPITMAMFRLLYQAQVYKKIDETVAVDYMLPFRMFSPPQSTSPNDTTSNLLNKMWNSHIQKAIDVRRKDKFAMFGFPFPVNYQEFGAAGKSLSPKDLIEYVNTELLDASGYPAELFRASLQIQQVPTAIRLFESTFWFIHVGMNKFVQWVSKSISSFLDEPYIEVGLEKPSLADNIDKQNILMQLGMQGEIPRSYFMGSLGVSDAVSAKTERMEEDMEIEKKVMELEEQFKKEMESRQAAGSIPSGDGMGNVPEEGGVSPMDVEEQANAKAQEWLSLPVGERRKAMEAQKGQNFNVYTMAKEIMEQMRRQGASDGRAAVEQQFQQ